jgi:hypothetical protein
MVRETVALSLELEHGVTLAQALSHAACVHQFCRDPASAKRRAQETIVLCAEQGIGPQYVASARVLLGWAMSVEGQTDQGLASSGGIYQVPVWLTHEGFPEWAWV